MGSLSDSGRWPKSISDAGTRVGGVVTEVQATIMLEPRSLGRNEAFAAVGVRLTW